MNNFFKKISKAKLLFATFIYATIYLTDIIAAYNAEIDRIRHKSIKSFGIDISNSIDFFDALKSANFHYTGEAMLLFFMIFIPFLLFSIYFFDYKTETNTGWKRIYISSQILIPTLLSLYLAISHMHEMQNGFIFFFVMFFGAIEIVVLISIKTLTWIREGFIERPNK
jgi:hypothetical protein